MVNTSMKQRSRSIAAVTQDLLVFSTFPFHNARGFLAMLLTPFRKTGELYPAADLPRASCNCILTCFDFGRALRRCHSAYFARAFDSHLVLVACLLSTFVRREPVRTGTLRKRAKQNRRIASWGKQTRKDGRNNGVCGEITVFYNPLPVITCQMEINSQELARFY